MNGSVDLQTDAAALTGLDRLSQKSNIRTWTYG
jgi:hypothetical protein